MLVQNLIKNLLKLTQLQINKIHRKIKAKKVNKKLKKEKL